MPKSKRDLLRRQVAHAHNNVELSAVHLIQVHDAFKEVHPDLAAPLAMLINNQIEVKSAIERWASDVWGRESIDWDSWRNVPEPNREDNAVE